MKTGLNLYQKYRWLLSVLNWIRFSLLKRIVGFDAANQFIQRVDKISIQYILNRNGASIGESCDIETGLIFHNCTNYKNLHIGNNCHIGKNCFFDLRDKISIGSNCVISMKCTFITHIDMSKSRLSDKYPEDSASILLENDCYLSVNTTILKGVIIGEGAFIGANSLVTKNVNSNVLVAGTPAKLIKNI